jgi:glycosyltransferase AglD
VPVPVNKRRLTGLVLRIVLVCAIVALAVRYARGLDAHAIGAALSRANPWLLLLSALGNAPLVWCKARRMRTLLAMKVPSSRLMALYVTSYAADNLVMSQAGLGLRVAFFRFNGVSLATAASAQAIEKALEAIGLGLVAGPFLWLPGKLGWLRGPVVWVTVGASVGLLIFLLALPRIGNRFVQNLAGGAAALKRLGPALEIAGLTFIAWIIEAVMVIAVLQAMHLDVPLWHATALILLAVNMAALVPGLPANVGTFEVSCSLALGAVGAPPAEALSFALVYHALHTVPVTLVGLAVQRWVRTPSEKDYGGSSPELEVSGTSSSTTSGR